MSKICFICSIKTGTLIADLKEQEDLGLKVAHLLIDINREIRTLEEKIKKTKNENEKVRLNLKLEMLKKGPQRYDQPKLSEHTAYLYNMISESPQKPGADAYIRYQQLKNEYEKYLNLK